MQFAQVDVLEPKKWDRKLKCERSEELAEDSEWRESGRCASAGVVERRFVRSPPGVLVKHFPNDEYSIDYLVGSLRLFCRAPRGQLASMIAQKKRPEGGSWTFVEIWKS